MGTRINIIDEILRIDNYTPEDRTPRNSVILLPKNR